MLSGIYLFIVFNSSSNSEQKTPIFGCSVRKGIAKAITEVLPAFSIRASQSHHHKVDKGFDANAEDIKHEGNEKCI